MDNRRFVNSYRALPEKKTPSNLERREILEAPREWMHFFNDVMKNYLAGEEPPEKQVMIDKIAEYYEWTQRFLEPLMQRARELDDPNEINDIANEFIFHQINGPLAFLWYSLLYSETNVYTPDEITDMQTHLAVSMAGPSSRLKKLDDNQTPETAKEYAMLKGTLSEADTVIPLMELMKTDNRLIVLPAPELFESNRRGNLNADILVIDTLNKQVQGAQVKTNTLDIVYDVDEGEKERTYNSNYVTVIDSAYELGNTTYTTKYSNRRGNLPGQLAMSLLSQRPINKPPFAVSKPTFLRSRQIAVELSRGRKSFLNQAVHHLAERILPELEQEASENHAEDEKSA